MIFFKINATMYVESYRSINKIESVIRSTLKRNYDLILKFDCFYIRFFTDNM